MSDVNSKTEVEPLNRVGISNRISPSNSLDGLFQNDKNGNNNLLLSHDNDKEILFSEGNI
jgi:hypothetical protein